MATIRASIFFVSSIFIVGCSTGYHEENMFGGYSDSRLTENTAVVRFNGDNETSFRQAHNDVLYRAAQITLDDGYDYFIVTSMTGVPVDVNVKTSHSYGNYVTDPPKLYTTYYRSTTYKSSSYSASPMMDCENCQRKMHGVVAVIQMFQGQKPAGSPLAYDARDVIAHIGPSTF